ncbi:hypothetical protein JCM30204_24080 [Dysgonomonas termitidis]
MHKKTNALEVILQWSNPINPLSQAENETISFRIKTIVGVINAQYIRLCLCRIGFIYTYMNYINNHFNDTNNLIQI